LYFKALVIGIISSFEFERIRILESLAGYSIYQLWIYGIFGIIHGIVGGYFLSKELKNNEKKRHTTMYNRNYGGFDYVRIHSELLRPVLNRKLTHINP